MNGGSMSLLFSPSEADDLRKRELPHATVKATLHDLQGAILFGAGRFSRALLPRLRQHGIKPAWFVDNNSSLWGQKLDGIEIRSAASLSEAGDRLVIIMTTYTKLMANTCRDAGVKRWSWFTDIEEVFGAYSITTSAENVLSNGDIDRLSSILKGSDESLATLKSALMFCVTGDPIDLPDCSPDQYFADDLVPDHLYKYFVDCGAYDGDTLREWVPRKARMLSPGNFKYHAFEPDPDNYSLLSTYVADLGVELQKVIVLHHCAVGDASGYVGMVQGGDGTQLYNDIETGITTPVVRLDEVLADEKVGIIKMDIEGFEPLALQGARGLLEKQRPALLICVYHHPEHLWTIPLWIHDLGLGYKLFLRHHGVTSSETVCYAIPASADQNKD
jgi:FkbM family methyltransferase